MIPFFTVGTYRIRVVDAHSHCVGYLLVHAKVLQVIEGGMGEGSEGFLILRAPIEPGQQIKVKVEKHEDGKRWNLVTVLEAPEESKEQKPVTAVEFIRQFKDAEKEVEEARLKLRDVSRPSLTSASFHAILNKEGSVTLSRPVFLYAAGLTVDYPDVLELRDFLNTLYPPGATL